MTVSAPDWLLEYLRIHTPPSSGRLARTAATPVGARQNQRLSVSGERRWSGASGPPRLWFLRLERGCPSRRRRGRPTRALPCGVSPKRGRENYLTPTRPETRAIPRVSQGNIQRNLRICQGYV